ncbi:hypothetical protein DMB66_47510 [Actinoplanes sp. ATCC 53533]|uniref:hypothetical protein n=1 Tax=Actinoplanes sp. ATCC 53533 TaxID=1288362 RepID=UPI000F7914B2|nr:hypothetical protein [Actinoplanes sp. ATCC 53533]RSM47783.1 hypothetical protein DMB66_47510 [Actinoplanes sp. ATCC 53533]
MDQNAGTNEQHTTAARRPFRAIARHLSHPVAHVTGLITAHTVALALLQKTPLFALLGLH